MKTLPPALPSPHGLRRLIVLSQFALALLLPSPPSSAAPVPLPGTAPLTLEGDLAAQLVGGIDRYLDRVLSNAPAQRARHWHRNFTSPDAYQQSIATNRARLAQILGVVDTRPPVVLQLNTLADAPLTASAESGHGPGFKAFHVAWSVFRDLQAEGLLLVPDAAPKASVVALPDCDVTPEQIAGLQPGLPPAQQFARRLAQQGCQVLIPCLVDRSDTHSGLPGVRHVRHSQREILWRAAYEMGRTVQGYEIQEALAAVDWLHARRNPAGTTPPIGIVGHGEGGLIALHAGALDPRIEVTVVSGYIPNPDLHDEPIYRNVWSYSDAFGPAEVAGLIAPRRLIWEHGAYPETTYPGPGKSHGGAAPGRLTPPGDATVEQLMANATAWLKNVPGIDRWRFVNGNRSDIINDETLSALDEALGLPTSLPSADSTPVLDRPTDTAARQGRRYSQILADTQWLMRESEFTRAEFWKKADRKDAARFTASATPYRQYLLEEIVGPIPPASLPPNPRTRKVSETDAFTGYEVVLDVHPDVFAYGILLVPKNIPAGERRPVVVCQHGLEGRPSDVADPKIDSQFYHAFACRLAERGFITFAPQNAYIGENRFRQVLRKAQPLKLTLWSFILRQHEVILDWLAAQEYVDPQRMAFYGLSYGGKTAMRIPPLIDRYCLSICSADYNEWIWKNVSIRSGYCYLNGGEYDMPEFNLGNTFNYAELSWLMIPRPFMVERGHDDGVAPDEWVAYEFAKTRRQYVKLGLGERTEMEVFDGPHTIHGKGTFDFLHRHLRWPRR